MDQNYTDITLVVDRSGSMHAIRGDAEGGINAFIKDQRVKPGRCTLTLVEFDDQYTVVHDGVPIGEAGEYSLQPRGATALLDAIGRAVDTTGARLAAMPEDQRPGLVVVVIVTDGHENASKERTKDAIAALIKQQQEQYSWRFQYLGANQDAIAVGGGLGVKAAAAATYSPQRFKAAMGATARAMTRARCAAAEGGDVDEALCYTEAERGEMRG